MKISLKLTLKSDVPLVFCETLSFEQFCILGMSFQVSNIFHTGVSLTLKQPPVTSRGKFCQEHMADALGYLVKERKGNNFVAGRTEWPILMAYLCLLSYSLLISKKGLVLEF
jgi:hypothetical protein